MKVFSKPLRCIGDRIGTAPTNPTCDGPVSCQHGIQLPLGERECSSPTTLGPIRAISGVLDFLAVRVAVAIGFGGDRMGRNAAPGSKQRRPKTDGSAWSPPTRPFSGFGRAFRMCRVPRVAFARSYSLRLLAY